MKKATGLVLAALICTMPMTAFAADSIHNPGAGNDYTTTTDNLDITATFEDKDDVTVHAYYVTVGWEQTGSIKYTDAYSTYTWNPTGVKYDKEVTNGKWTLSSPKVAITVTNKSDNAVNVSCAEPTATGSVTAITGSYDKDTFTLASAAKGLEETGEAQTGTATYTISGVEGKISSEGTIGTLTVTVAK